MLLGFTFHQRTHSITQILNIIINREPLVHIGSIEIDTIANGNISTYKILSFNSNNVRYLIILITKKCSMLQNICGLRLTRTQLKLLEGLVIIQQNSLRTTNNLALAIFRNDISRIASPNIDAHNAIQLRINSDSARLGIGSTTRDRSITFQISESLYVSNITSACGHGIQSIQICSIDNVLISHCLFYRLLRQTAIIIEDSLITGEPQITLAIAQLTLNNYLSSGVR